MESVYQKAFRNARLYLKISLRNFAPQLGVDRAFISRIENDKQKPSMALLKKLETFTGFSFWALANGDFKAENQEKYIKLSSLNFDEMEIGLHELNPKQRNYLHSKLSVEIIELKDVLAEEKNKLAYRLEKSNLYKGELEYWETTLQKAQTALDFLTQSQAPEDMIVAQQKQVDKIAKTWENKKMNLGILGEDKVILEQIALQELEFKIKLRESKLEEIDKLVG
jgi:transcriptional regulator with XRE-family HTH domain